VGERGWEGGGRCTLSRRELVTTGGREARGDREKEGKKDKTVEREGGSLLG